MSVEIVLMGVAGDGCGWRVDFIYDFGEIGVAGDGCGLWVVFIVEFVQM